MREVGQIDPAKHHVTAHPIGIYTILNTQTGTPASIVAVAAGNTIIRTPTAGKSTRVKFIMVWNAGVATNYAGLRFAAAGTVRFVSLLAINTGSLINLIGAYWQGGVDEVLYVNCLNADNISITVMYDEV